MTHRFHTFFHLRCELNPHLITYTHYNVEAFARGELSASMCAIVSVQRYQVALDTGENCYRIAMLARLGE